MENLALKHDTTELESVLNKLIEMTNKDAYDPFKQIIWPSDISKTEYWMSPDLMSINGTEYDSALSSEQKIRLSQWEFVNFCSLNVTGIRELLLEMTARLHTPGFELLSEYLHVLIGEENEHMWYFSKFCLKYSGKIYPDRAISSSGLTEPDLMNIVIFIRVLVFEEIVDFYNRKMGKDKSLPEFIREINWLHHLDEGRHIKYGRMYISVFYKQLQEKYSEDRLLELEKIVKTFMKISVQKLYRREMYIDAGIDEPGKLRKALINHPARAEFNANIIAGTAKFFTKIGLFSSPNVWETEEQHTTAVLA